MPCEERGGQRVRVRCFQSFCPRSTQTLEHPFERLLRDARILQVIEQVDDHLLSYHVIQKLLKIRFNLRAIIDVVQLEESTLPKQELQARISVLKELRCRAVSVGMSIKRGFCPAVDREIGSRQSRIKALLKAIRINRSRSDQGNIEGCVKTANSTNTLRKIGTDQGLTPQEFELAHAILNRYSESGIQTFGIKS